MLDELDRQESFPPSWKPKIGDVLVGTIRGYTKPFDIQGERVDVAEVETDEGDHHSLWLTNAVLLSKFRELRPRVGETTATRPISPGDSSFSRPDKAAS